MNCRIDTTPDFAQELKQLAKRYPSMKDDYKTFLERAAQEPSNGYATRQEIAESAIFHCL